MNINTFFVSILLSLLSATCFASDANLNILVDGIQSNEGRIRLAVYTSDEHFGNEKWALTVRETVAKKGTVEFKLLDLPAASYGIIVYHDSNRNGTLDRRLWMMSAEGNGASNNPSIGTTPGFDNSSFDLVGDKTMHIKLNYCQSAATNNQKKSIKRTVGCWLSQAD